MHRLKSAALGVAVVTASLLLAAPSTAGAQANIAGAWVVTVDSPQGAMTLDTTFKQEGEKVTGEVNSPMGSVDFTGTLGWENSASWLVGGLPFNATPGRMGGPMGPSIINQRNGICTPNDSA